MGGFYITGPTKTIKYKHMTNISCKCPGEFIDATQEQEDKFVGKTSMTLEEFHSIFDNKYIKSHIHVHDPKAKDPNVLY